MNNVTVGANMALRIAENITRENVGRLSSDEVADISEMLLSMSLEGNAWSGREPGSVFLTESSKVATRLMKGNVHQASAVARNATDENLLERMARSERRRGVRGILASNPYLNSAAIESLWNREVEDSSKTGANPFVMAELISRMEPRRAAAAYVEAFSLYWTHPGQRAIIAQAVANAIAAGDEPDVATDLVIDTCAQAPVPDYVADKSWNDPNMAELAAYALSVHVMLGSIAIPRESWSELMELAGRNYVDLAGQAAWIAAQESDECVLDDTWVAMAAQSYSWRKPGWNDTLGRRQNIRLNWVECLDKLSPEQQEDLGSRATTYLADRMVYFCDTIPAGLLMGVLDNPRARTVVRESIRTFTVSVRNEDQVTALLDVTEGSQIRQDWYTWIGILERTELSVPTQRRMLSGHALSGWLGGVNGPKTAQELEEVLDGVPGCDVASRAPHLSRAFERSVSEEVREHLWLTTPGLPGVFVKEHYTNPLSAFTTKMLIERLGADASAWDVVLRLLPDWGGSFGELLDVSAAL